MKRVIVTGSSGLIGSEAATYFSRRGFRVCGVDNNQRARFFGEQGDTRWNQQRLLRDLSAFEHHELDIRDRQGVRQLVDLIRPDVLVHAAAQPSHDLAAEIPFDDFDINAGGTLNLLEAMRQVCPDSPFIHLSTNKVYGDRPNQIALAEKETRWTIDDPHYAAGISESFDVDQSQHSLFGASKLAGDIYVQEYGRYFGMPTCCLRGGCLTGPHHSGVMLHGFLSHLIRCNLESRQYTVYGYKGKQVRDNIHAVDVVRFIGAFASEPRCAEVYNIGGGFANSCSILEAFQRVEAISGNPMDYVYVDSHRQGDHICYYSDLSKIRRDYPKWELSKSLDDIFSEIVEGWRLRVS